MQWEELVKKAKKLDYKHYVNTKLNIDSLIKDLSNLNQLDFEKKGEISSYLYGVGYICLAKDRTPEQMYQIMEALK